jgi:hypothetical protein
MEAKFVKISTTPRKQPGTASKNVSNLYKFARDLLLSKKSRPHLDVERGWSGANEHFPQQNSNILKGDTVASILDVCTLFSGTLYESDRTRGTIRKI